jgi:quinolinate synthase
LDTDIISKIRRLKERHNAVILAHNYQTGEVQDIADFTGDSLGLSVQASKTTADVIVFCGVRFMAETAKILSPHKTVLLPDEMAGCPMADMIDASRLRQLKAKHPKALVVCYVNTTAEVKAESDYCCTSSNAVDLVKSLPADREIIFVPDKNLGQFVSERTGREMILWPGYCVVHARITGEDIIMARENHPDAVVIAHPECSKDVRDSVDELLSTGGMLKFASTSQAKEFVVVTETGIIHTLRKRNPDKKFYPVSTRMVCSNMKKINLEKVLWSLEDMKYEVTVNERIAERARLALERMLEVLPGK